MLARALILALLLALPVPAEAAQYVVRPGDTLSSIAARYRVSVRTLARWNGIVNVNLVPVGRVLVIPTPMRRTAYRVQWGDTLSGIAARYGTTIATIRSLNPTLGTYPLAGQVLRVCSPCSGGVAVAQVATSGTISATGTTTYIVRGGDTLSGIAAAYGTTADALVSLNGLSNPDLVVIGTRLSVPVGNTVPATSSRVYQPYDPATVRSLLTQYSYTYGIEPALALAISWQESGFNQNMISSTGAIGVMQVEPYTGRHIAWLLGRRINLYSVQDNAMAGVYWIATLVRYYGGDERWAVAAYYQGSRSLAQRGWFIDTRQYVNNVMSLRTYFGG